MKISIEHFEGKYPQFNVSLATKEGVEPFITIKGCRLVNGSKGQFISWPAKKLDSGKYWNHVFVSEPFAQAVLEAALASMPKPDTRTHGERQRGVQDDLSGVPF